MGSPPGPAAETPTPAPGGAVPASEHMYSPAMAPTENCAAPGGWIGLVETEAMTSGSSPLCRIIASVLREVPQAGL